LTDVDGEAIGLEAVDACKTRVSKVSLKELAGYEEYCRGLEGAIRRCQLLIGKANFLSWVIAIIEEYLDAPMPETKPSKATMLPRKPEDWPSLFEQNLNAGDISRRSWHYTNRMPASWRDPAKQLSAATGFVTC
jgi:hypothetical protein